MPTELGTEGGGGGGTGTPPTPPWGVGGGLGGRGIVPGVETEDELRAITLGVSGSWPKWRHMQISSLTHYY